MRTAALGSLAVLMAWAAWGEDLLREGFDGEPKGPPLERTWGTAPVALTTNAVEVSPEGTPAAHPSATYPQASDQKLCYWTYHLPTPVPLVPQLETISFRVKTNAPVSIKIGLSPFGFIYHGPGVAAADGWQTVTLPNAYPELAKWCAGGQKQAQDGYVESVIIALGGSPGNGGYSPEGTFGLIASGEPLPPPPGGQKRTVRATVIECEPDMDRLIAKLDEYGKQGCDIVCLWECVWYATDDEVVKHRERNRASLARVADAARRNAMYVVIAGELERGFSESILFDRQGQEMDRYTKILQTTARESKYYQEGDRVGVFGLDFGRICTKIRNDVNGPDVDRVAALHQVDLMLLSTQDAGPYSENIRLREAHRCVDCGYFLLRAAAPGEETDHRSDIMDPWGMILAGAELRVNSPPLIATLNLDNRPAHYEWPEAVRRAGDLPDPAKRGIPEADRLKMYGRFNRPQAKGDLRAVVLSCRRPELYRPRPTP